MSRKVESLKRLYNSGRMSKERLEQLYVNGDVTKDEFYYITGEYPTSQPSVDLTDVQRDMVVDEIREGVENGTAN